MYNSVLCIKNQALHVGPGSMPWLWTSAVHSKHASHLEILNRITSCDKRYTNINMNAKWLIQLDKGEFFFFKFLRLRLAKPKRGL